MDRFLFCGKHVTNEKVQKTISSINRFKVGDKVFVITNKEVSQRPLTIRVITVIVWNKAFNFRYQIGYKQYGLTNLWKKRNNAYAYLALQHKLGINVELFHKLVECDEKGIIYGEDN